MKKITYIFILFLCLSCSEQLYSQSYIGVKGGVTIPTVNFADLVNTPITTRFRTAYFVSSTYGISYRYMQNEKVGIQVDFNYATKGWGQNTLEFTNTFITRINYLEVPFFFHWRVFGTPKFKFVLNAGPYVGWALSANQTIENQSDLEENQIIYSVDNDNRGDFGIYAGGGFSYDFNVFILQLDGSFRSGFANILPFNHFTKQNPVVSTNQVPAVELSILFPLSK